MLTIRPATPEDIPEILDLIRELAEYEKLTHLVAITEEDLRRGGWISGQTGRICCKLRV
jgi:N-acetylglutamate synthase-like GNAT family acetyltransferase